MRSELKRVTNDKAARRTRWAERIFPQRLFFAFLALYFLTFGGHLYSGDGVASYFTARSFIEGNGGAADNYWKDPRFLLAGPDGKIYSKYGLGQVLVEIPLVVVAKGVAGLSGGGVETEDGMARFLVSSLNLFVCAYSAVLLCGMTRRLGYGIRTGVGVALLYGLATMSWAYSKLDFSEPLMTLCYLLMAQALFTQSPSQGKAELTPRQMLWAGGWLGAAILIKPVAGLALFPLLIYVVFRLKQGAASSTPTQSAVPSPQSSFSPFSIFRLLKLLLWLALPLVIAGAVVLWYNLYRYGKITESGYSAIPDQFALGSFYGGIFGFLFSPGKSMFLYAPGLLLAFFGLRQFWQRWRAEAIFGLALFLTYLIFYSLFWNWEGDWTWGPRYLMPTFPFIILWAAPLLEQSHKWVRYAFNLLLTLGILVNVFGTLVEFNYYFYVFRAPEVGQDWRYIPELSPLRGQVYLSLSATTRAVSGNSLRMDYLGWDSERTRALKQYINMYPYDKFDFWWLRSLNPTDEGSNGLSGLPIALVLGLVFGGVVWWCWRRMFQVRDIIAELSS